jgi:orotate phosphoribosyltransferase
MSKTEMASVKAIAMSMAKTVSEKEGIEAAMGPTTKSVAHACAIARREAYYHVPRLLVAASRQYNTDTLVHGGHAIG